MSEYPASANNQRFNRAADILEMQGLIDVSIGPELFPTSICASPGLRVDTIRLAEKAADATGIPQVIEYGYDVRIQITDGDNPEYLDVRKTWVLPDPARRQAIVAAMLRANPQEPVTVANLEGDEFSIPDTELPGMWEKADFEGGPETVRGPGAGQGPAAPLDLPSHGRDAGLD